MTDRESGERGATSGAVPQIESLRILNYRALRDIEFRDLARFSVLVGPNGSGKSTVFDVFAFLSECFTDGVKKAMNRRGRFKELRTKGADGPITIELKYRERPPQKGDPKSRRITYHLALQEGSKGPEVSEEWLEWTRQEGKAGRPFRFLELSHGKGTVVSGEVPDQEESRGSVELDSAEVLGVSTLGQFAEHPRVSALRRFVTDWYLSYLSADGARRASEAGPQERLTVTGDNLPNVMQYVRESHPGRLTDVLNRLKDRVPRLEDVTADIMPDGRLLLRIKDGPFDDAIQARFASDGTLKMLAYLLVLYDPDPPQFVGIEEPENYLHPSLLAGLAEECREASGHSQLMVTTHSPFFVNALNAKEVWVLYRDEDGYTQAKRAHDMKGIPEFMKRGALLGDLWMESFFEFGYPRINQGGATRRSSSGPGRRA